MLLRIDLSVLFERRLLERRLLLLLLLRRLLGLYPERLLQLLVLVRLERLLVHVAGLLVHVPGGVRTEVVVDPVGRALEVGHLHAGRVRG